MTTIETTTTTIDTARDDFVIDEAQLAAVAFLARYSGRTLDAYRLRTLSSSSSLAADDRKRHLGRSGLRTTSGS
jgi:hypothetical protein